MKEIISAKTAGGILLVIFGLLIVFHILVLLNLIPSNMVWGGQAGGSPSNLRTLEIISLVLTVLFTVAVALRIGYLDAPRLAVAVRVFMWFIFAYLLLNTLGNLASSSSMEKLIFTPLTLLAALLTLRLAIGD